MTIYMESGGWRRGPCRGGWAPPATLVYGNYGHDLRHGMASEIAMCTCSVHVHVTQDTVSYIGFVVPFGFSDVLLHLVASLSL